MNLEIENYTLPAENGLRFLLKDILRTSLIILTVVVFNFLLLGLYILFLKFNFINYMLFIGLLGVGIYFIINPLNSASKHSERANPNSDKSLGNKKKTAHLLTESESRIERIKNILRNEDLSNNKVRNEELDALDDVPAYERRYKLSDSSTEQEELLDSSTEREELLDSSTEREELLDSSIEREELHDSSTEHEKVIYETVKLREEEFEGRVKTILFELFIELKKEIESLEYRKVHTLEHDVVKQIKEVEDQDIKKVKQLLTILYELLGEDFLNEHNRDMNIEKFLDIEYMKTIIGKLKPYLLYKPTH
jgi:hypothetical protein